ncbi:MAG TPA: acylphosphatase [Trueperaceae bacterium]|nr:acylphosphatase [Trueperaceae bacterium]
MTEPHGTRRFTAIISGHVQGVGYRAFVRRNATDLHLRGHVENLADGRVEVVAEGAQDDLDVLIARLRLGPTHSVVTNIELEWADAAGAKPGFHAY